MKERLDILVTKNNLADSRQKAQAMIMEGIVFVDGQREDKVGSKFDENVKIEIKGKKLPYVSRGGLKLEKAIKAFSILLNEKVCIDIGASTGGFTDCMLKNGAKKVYSVDVGYGQLDYRLRNDDRVVCMEKTNIRYVTKDMFECEPSFGSVDVSFISLKLVLPKAREIMTEDAYMVCLIKPQFEAGREKVGKKGVVRDPLVHCEVISEITKFAVTIGYHIIGLDFSPIKGPEGNIEYLMYITTKSDVDNIDTKVSDSIEDVVNEAHGCL